MFAPLFSGLWALAVLPTPKSGSLVRAAFTGGLVGLVAYAAYDLTNQATLRGWDVRITQVDVTWEVFASASASAAAYSIAS